MVNFIKDLPAMIVVTVFAFGWMDMGQGPEYTWWNLIYYFAN